MDYLSRISGNYTETEDYPSDELIEQELPLEVENDEGHLKIQYENDKLIYVSEENNQQVNFAFL